MTITQHGLSCDVCGKYILPFERGYERFRMEAFPSQELHCHLQCKEPVLKAVAANDWKLFPLGPIRTAFQNAEKEDLP